MTISSVKLSGVNVSSALLLLSLVLSGCGGTDSQTPPLPPVGQNYGLTPQTSSFYTLREFVNPSPPKSSETSTFARRVEMLPNGNFIVSDYLNSSVAVNSGAVHLYSPDKQQPLASFYGDNSDDRIAYSFTIAPHGEGYDYATAGILALPNNNFVIASPFADVNGNANAGSVLLVNGFTGEQIGETLVGDVAGDSLGYGIYSLNNGNFAISSPYADKGSIQNAGSVKIINGNTGLQIGDTYYGAYQDDYLGSNDAVLRKGVRVLANGNILIASMFADNSEFVNAGSIILLNGETGKQIGSTIFGQDNDSFYLQDGRLQVLSNSNIISLSSTYSRALQLINGSTADIVKADVFGLFASDILNFNAVELDNNNAVLIVRTTNSIDVGLFNTLTGELLNGVLTFATDVTLKATPLPNHNVVISANDASIDGVSHAGFAMLLDGVSGKQIGDRLSGSEKNDYFAQQVMALQNNNVVISSAEMHVGALQKAGSLMLLDGETWLPVMPTLYGTRSAERLGQSAFLLSNDSLAFLKGAEDSADTLSLNLAILNGSSGTVVGQSSVLDKQTRLSQVDMQELDNNVLAINFLVKDPATHTTKLFDVNSAEQVGDTFPVNNAADNADECGYQNPLTAIGEGYYVCLTQNQAAFILNGANGKQVGETITAPSQWDFSGGFVLSKAQAGDFILALPDYQGKDSKGKIVGIQLE